MNKTLKFVHHFVPSVLKQKEGITTRLFDEKNLAEGDLVDFLDATSNEKFATARITKVKEMTFAEAMNDAADTQGMYQQYETYYQKPVTPETPLKMIYFEIIP